MARVAPGALVLLSSRYITRSSISISNSSPTPLRGNTNKSTSHFISTQVNEEEFEYGDGMNDDEDNEDEGHEDEGIEEDDDRKMYEDREDGEQDN